MDEVSINDSSNNGGVYDSALADASYRISG